MKNILISILSVICVVLLYILTTILYIAYNRPIMEKLGQAGDFIGGMFNPIFAFLSFALLCYTVILQRKELAHSIEELQATRDELKATKEANQSMAKTQEQQRFENTFFSLLDTIDKKITNKRNAIEGKKKTFVYIIEHNIDSDYSCFTINGDFKEISMMIYQMLNFVDQSQKDDSAKTYIRFLRSSLDEDVLHTLFIFCYKLNLINTPKSDKYLELIKKYTLFEHISLNLCQSIKIEDERYLLKDILKFYGGYDDDCGAFGDSQYLENAKKQIQKREKEEEKEKERIERLREECPTTNAIYGSNLQSTKLK